MCIGMLLPAASDRARAAAGAFVDLRVQDEGCGGVTQKDQDQGNAQRPVCAASAELGAPSKIDSPPRSGTTC